MTFCPFSFGIRGRIRTPTLTLDSAIKFKSCNNDWAKFCEKVYVAKRLKKKRPAHPGSHQPNGHLVLSDFI